jgi:hypothetical protein
MSCRMAWAFFPTPPPTVELPNLLQPRRERYIASPSIKGLRCWCALMLCCMGRRGKQHIRIGASAPSLVQSNTGAPGTMIVPDREDKTRSVLGSRLAPSNFEALQATTGRRRSDEKVEGACNHPNLRVLPFSVRMERIGCLSRSAQRDACQKTLYRNCAC